MSLPGFTRVLISCAHISNPFLSGQSLLVLKSPSGKRLHGVAEHLIYPNSSGAVSRRRRLHARGHGVWPKLDLGPDEPVRRRHPQSVARAGARV